MNKYIYKQVTSLTNRHQYHCITEISSFDKILICLTLLPHIMICWNLVLIDFLTSSSKICLKTLSTTKYTLYGTCHIILLRFTFSNMGYLLLLYVPEMRWLSEYMVNSFNFYSRNSIVETFLFIANNWISVQYFRCNCCLCFTCFWNKLFFSSQT